MRIVTAFLTVLMAPVVAAAPLNAQGPIKLKSGEIVGITVGDDEPISTYLGIPYAAPPVGELRWKPPEPPERWKGVVAMRSFGPVAPQTPNPFGGVGADADMSEDCLYLNVWTPASSKDDRLPVMVWIHGGGFRVGAGSLPMYDGTNLARKGVVLVTFNYRLNILGNFAHPLLAEESRRDASGNYGLLDQVAALEWVQQNIEVFGGDPENVTIFGESAGARSVAVHMASPLSRGLFHRAIAQSGALRDTGFPYETRVAAGRELATEIGAGELEDPLEYMRSLSWEELPGAGSFPSNPIVDGYFLEEPPEETFRRGAAAYVPLLHGTNADEATYILMRDMPQRVADYVELVRNFATDHEDRLLMLYPPPKTDDQVRDAANVFLTDIRMALHQRNLAKWVIGAGGRTYLYYFDRVPPSPIGERLGAHHGAEIRYVFGNFEGDTGFEPTRTDRILSETMMDYWTHFAMTGNPNTTGQPLWPPYDPVLDQVMELGDDIGSRFRVRRAKLNGLERLLYPEVQDIRPTVLNEDGNKKRRKRR